MLLYYKKVRKRHFEGYPLEYLYFVPVQNEAHSSVLASASGYFPQRPCGQPAAGRATVWLPPQRILLLAAPSSEWDEGLVLLCFEAPVTLWWFAELGHADEKPLQSADEPQNSRNIPQPERIQRSGCCTCIRMYHFAVELPEHFPLQMFPHPERHSLPSGRFFLPHNCWENPTAPTAGAPPAPDKVSLHLLLSRIRYRLPFTLPCLDFRQWPRLLSGLTGKPPFTGAGGHKLVELGIFRKTVDERNEGTAILDKARPGFHIGDVVHLLV